MTGIPMSQIRKQNKKLPLTWLLIGINPDRPLLYERIEKRVDTMLEKGLIQETRDIISRYGAEAYSLGNIGYRHARDYILGKISFDEMVATLKLDTRHYAKRQITWFKKIPGIHWFSQDNREEMSRLLEEFLSRKSTDSGDEI